MAGFVDGTPELMEKTDSGTSNPPPMGFSERELYIALRIDMTAADARRLAMEMALAQEVAERLDKEDTETVDPASESRIETNIASYTLQLLACQGPEVERRVESYMRRKGWLDDPAYVAWKEELERLRPIVTLRMQQLKEE
jgi:hypothetical protein